MLIVIDNNYQILNSVRKEGIIMKKSILWVWHDKNKAMKQGSVAINQRQRDRLSEIVYFARANSPYYKELYKGLPERVEDVKLLPTTSKKELMPHFDDWVTDRSVNMEDIRAFVDNLDMIGELYHGKYTVATSSGTTGKRGIFLFDEEAIAVNFALSLKARSGLLGFNDVIKVLYRGGRTAVVAATGGHFLVSAGVSRMRKRSNLLGSSFKLFSVHTPMVQPILRYDLGDSIMMKPGPCRCGNPHPAIRVQGRASDVLTFLSEVGEQVSIIPLAFTTLIDSIPGISQFQIVQTTEANLRVRLLCTTDSNSHQIWELVYKNIMQLLLGNNVHNITVERGNEPPEKTTGGKLRTIIPFKID